MNDGVLEFDVRPSHSPYVERVWRAVRGHDARRDRTGRAAVVASVRDRCASSGAGWGSVDEEVTYGGVLFASDGVPFGGVFAYAEHVSVEFGQGASIADPFGFLEGGGEGRRHVELRSESDIDAKRLAAYLPLALEASRGVNGPRSGPEARPKPRRRTRMPVVTIKLARREPPTPAETKAELVAGVTALLVETLGKRPEDVVVLIEELDPANWGQGGETATELRRRRAVDAR